MSELVSVTIENEVAQVHLNRPEKLNAFNDELVEALLAAVSDVRASDARLCVFRGEGKGFSGGFDLSGLEDASDGDLLLRFVRVEELLQTVYHAPFATLALVHGACYGAAADLVAACHWRISSPDARFRLPGLRFGIVLGTRRLSETVGADHARDLLLRDRPFAADEALSRGFINQILSIQDWLQAIEQKRASVTDLSSAAFAALCKRTQPDNRDADLAALVRSASYPSLKKRLSAFLEQAARR